jgi:Na+-translocating ferredoxin:NAD+ oxidoreductase RnfA subunit
MAEEQEKFDVWNQVLTTIAASLGFVISLSLNSAFKETFDLIPISVKNKVANAWLYVFVVGALVLLFLWGIFEAQAARKRAKLGAEERKRRQTSLS